jgi:hypothetical protein
VLEEGLRVPPRRPQLVPEARERDGPLGLDQPPHVARHLADGVGVGVEVPAHPHRVPRDPECRDVGGVVAELGGARWLVAGLTQTLDDSHRG